jgi:hypothetical protein
MEMTGRWPRLTYPSFSEGQARWNLQEKLYEVQKNIAGLGKN